MFTGLVQSIGKILELQKINQDLRLVIKPAKKFEQLVIGESIAVNGTCLTVESFDNQSFTVFASAETLSCSNLKFLKLAASVNLERALILGDRLGGHLVSGHVDALCEVLNIQKVGNSTCYRLALPARFVQQVIPKGSVCLDGVSLTVNACSATYFEVNIIPETLKETLISTWVKGQQVNLETDLLSKYVERMLGFHLLKTDKAAKKDLDLNFFLNNGF